jgi:hypothetical protein
MPAEGKYLDGKPESSGVKVVYSPVRGGSPLVLDEGQ